MTSMCVEEPQLSHTCYLLITDLSFCRAFDRKVEVLQYILTTFEKSFGLRMNSKNLKFPLAGTCHKLLKPTYLIS